MTADQVTNYMKGNEIHVQMSRFNYFTTSTWYLFTHSLLLYRKSYSFVPFLPHLLMVKYHVLSMKCFVDVTLFIPKFALCISRPFTLNLKQAVFIDRIYRINHTETWNFNALTLVTSVSDKITAKCGILCPKTLLLTQKQLHTIQFFVATRNVCSLAIPKSCAQNMSIRLLENHSLQMRL